jgi:hypothetical protein
MAVESDVPSDCTASTTSVPCFALLTLVRSVGNERGPLRGGGEGLGNEGITGDEEEDEEGEDDGEEDGCKTAEEGEGDDDEGSNTDREGELGALFSSPSSLTKDS